MTYASRTRASHLLLPLLTLAAAAGGCAAEAPKGLYANVIAETEVEVGRQNVTVAVGVGRGRALVEVPAASVARPTRMRVRIVSELLPRGRVPASDLAVDIGGQDLDFIAPVRLRQVVPPAPPMRRYHVVQGVDRSTGFVTRSAGTVVAAAEDDDQEWEATIQSIGLWGFALDEEADRTAAVRGCQGFASLFAACVPEAAAADITFAQSECDRLRARYEPGRTAGLLNPSFLPIFDDCIGTSTNTAFCAFARDEETMQPSPESFVEACNSWAALKASPPSYRNDAALDACLATRFEEEAPSCRGVLAGPADACNRALESCEAADPNFRQADDVCYLTGLPVRSSLPAFEACASRSCADIAACYDEFVSSNFTE